MIRGGDAGRTLRYLVRSYVTNPTTMSAITEIPAKTPKPIGSTDNCFPGRVKAADVDCEDSAAAADAEAEALAEAASAVPEVAA